MVDTLAPLMLDSPLVVRLCCECSRDGRAGAEQEVGRAGSGGWLDGWIWRGKSGHRCSVPRWLPSGMGRPYIDPNAGKVRFEVVAERWLRSRVVDPASTIRYESSLRLHVAPVFGRRQLRSIKPSEIAGWIADLDARFGSSTARTAFIVLHGTLELAVGDESIKRNPAKARVVKVPAENTGRVVAWSDETVFRIVKCHPPLYRPIASIGAASGLRQGEIFGLAEEDIDFDEMVIHVRRQVQKLGKDFVFALLPKE
jgi:integrase